MWSRCWCRAGSAVPQGQRTQKRVAIALNPEKRYRELTDAVEIADTIANRAALAEECMALEKFEEAKRHYEVILARPLGDEPVYMVGKAQAQFGFGQAADTVAILDDLRHRWPDYQSAEAHLLYARALEACGRNDEALAEYRALSDYFVGAEARVRYGLLLARTGPRRRSEGLAHRGCAPAPPRAEPRRSARRPSGSRKPSKSCAPEARLPRTIWGQGRQNRFGPGLSPLHRGERRPPET